MLTINEVRQACHEIDNALEKYDPEGRSDFNIYLVFSVWSTGWAIEWVDSVILTSEETMAETVEELRMEIAREADKLLCQMEQFHHVFRMKKG